MELPRHVQRLPEKTHPGAKEACRSERDADVARSNENPSESVTKCEEIGYLKEGTHDAKE